MSGLPSLSERIESGFGSVRRQLNQKIEQLARKRGRNGQRRYVLVHPRYTFGTAVDVNGILQPGGIRR